MKTKSIWMSHTLRRYPSLDTQIAADVAIIGAGICGITTAKLLSDQGLSCVVLEGHQVAQSNTGRSTGNLYSLVDIPFTELRKKYSFDEIQKVIQSRQEAVKLIESNINDYGLSCDFQRVPWTRFSAIPEADESILNEFTLLKEHYPELEWLEKDHPMLLRLKGRLGFILKGQAQFNPYEYVQQLTNQIADKCQVFEETHVQEIKKDDEIFILKTPKGSVRSSFVIEATHTPLGFSPLQTVLGPYREYGVAGKAMEGFSHEGIFWGYYEKDKVTSIRSYFRDGSKYMMIIGEPHKVGQEDSEKSAERLKLRGTDLNLFSKIDFTWGGQHYRPADLLPYIGESMERNHFLATGFSTDGLVFGTVAAKVISNSITQNSDPYSEIYNPKRFTPLKSAKNFVKENINVIKQYTKDYLHKEGSKSKICTHMGCIVHWNNLENSWDCPCHGSRFQEDGEVIEGPALNPLRNEPEVHP